MQDAKSTAPEAVRDALAAADYETFYSRIKFTPQGDGDAVLMGAMVGQVQQGQVKIIFPESARTAAPIYPMPRWDQRG